MYCSNCGAEVAGGNFCSCCGQALTETTTSISLLNKAVSTANLDDRYSLVLVSCGTCTRTMTGDLLEDIFGYTDAESTELVNMAPVVVGERLNINEASAVAQMLTEYGVQVSVTNEDDQYVDLTSHATTSVFDTAGNLLSGIAAVIGSLTAANRIRSYRRFKKPSLLERLFRINYKPNPPEYRRNFRPHLAPAPVEPRRTIRKAPARPQQPRMDNARRPAGGSGSHGGPGGSGSHGGPGKSGGHGAPGGSGSHGGPGGRRK